MKRNKPKSSVSLLGTFVQFQRLFLALLASWLLLLLDEEGAPGDDDGGAIGAAKTPESGRVFSQVRSLEARN